LVTASEYVPAVAVAPTVAVATDGSDTLAVSILPVAEASVETAVCTAATSLSRVFSSLC